MIRIARPKHRRGRGARAAQPADPTEGPSEATGGDTGDLAAAAAPAAATEGGETAAAETVPEETAAEETPVAETAAEGTPAAGGRRGLTRGRRVLIAAAVVVVLGGAGGALVLATTSGRSRVHVAAPTTTTSTSTTTTVVAAPAVLFPLTGKPAHDPALAQRPALSVKIDNAPPARPQAGLNNADLVTEELVEGGLSRFFVTFQSQDAARIGPIRSARPVDADLLAELNGGIFAYSGAAAGEIAPTLNHGNAILLSDDAGSPGFHRDPHRYGPYNLYSSTSELYRAGMAKGTKPPPPQLFTYGAASSTTPATTVSLGFSPLHSAAWFWDAGTQLYNRAQDGGFHTLEDGALVTADNVVVLSVGIRSTSITDQSGAHDPLVVVVGSGPAWVFRDGVVEQGTWQRPSYGVPVKITGADGQPLPLHPGRTWLELLPQPAKPGF